MSHAPSPENVPETPPEKEERSMAGALIMMGIMLLALAVATYAKAGGEGLVQALKATGTTGGKFVPVLLIAFLIMGFLEVLIPREFVERWLSDAAGWRGILIAWVAGIATPAGSLVGLPIAAGIAKAGAGAAVVVTYLVSFGLLSIVRLPIELGIIGPRFTVMRIAACVLLPPIAGLIASAIAPALQRLPSV